MKRSKLTIALAVIALASCDKHSSEEPVAEPQQKAPAKTESTSEESRTKPVPPLEEPFMKDIDAKQAGEFFKLQRPLVVLDVRTPGEFAAGHLKGAVNLDFNSAAFKEELAALDPEKTYLMHCQSGGRSGKAKAAFTELGFKYLYHLDGGYAAWEDAGLPTEK
ncbi:MAG: rhodanese-related sulfurtransferase [Verrucomicrobiales bacterium]|jgi:rhodanese-related sulfurtransferase